MPNGSTSRAALWPPSPRARCSGCWGAKDLGTTDDYLKEKMPAVNVGLLDGELAWRQHDGGHTDGPNIEHFIAWANGKFAQRNEKSDNAGD